MYKKPRYVSLFQFLFRAKLLWSSRALFLLGSAGTLCVGGAWRLRRKSLVVKRPCYVAFGALPRGETSERRIGSELVQSLNMERRPSRVRLMSVGSHPFESEVVQAFARPQFKRPQNLMVRNEDTNSRLTQPRSGKSHTPRRVGFVPIHSIML